MSTKIDYVDEVWNPITGCSPVSAGCDNCYAKRMANRLRGRFGYPADDPFRVTFHENRMELPLKWKKPRRIFVNSMGDLLHPRVQGKWLDRIFEVMEACPQHTFMALTKRPENYQMLVNGLDNNGNISDQERPLPYLDNGVTLLNLWWGVSAENQQATNERIPILLQIPAAKRFVSVEPMLGAVNLGKWLLTNKIDWCIIGAENAVNARNMNEEWVRSLIKECKTQIPPISVFYKAKRQGRKMIKLPLLDGIQYAEFPRTTSRQSED